MKLLLIFILGFSTFLYADKSVTKSSTINTILFPDKTQQELKDIALQKAKLAAAKEIFGEFLLSETVMMNGNIIKDIVRENSGGVIHIKGEPIYENGQNLSEIKVTIHAYVTDEELADVSPHIITLNNFKYSNEKLPIKKLKSTAEDAFIMEALSSKKPSIVNSTAAEARKLILSINIRKFDFDETTFSYVISGDIEYIPAFLRHANSISNNTVDEQVKALKDSNYVTQENTIKRGFYGEWAGFIMSSNGGNFSVNITITSNGESTIEYPSLHCGGDLIIQSKTTKIVTFKEALTYGENLCDEYASIKLKISGDKRIQFTTYDADKKQRSSGTLFRK